MKKLLSFALIVSGLITGAATSAHAQVVSQAPENFVLSGVIVYEGGGGLAWLQEPTYTGNQVRAVRPGDSVGPYRLVRILDDRVDFEGPKGPLSIPLQGGHGGSATAVAGTMPVTPAPAVSPRPTPAPAAPAVATAPQPAAAPRPTGQDTANMVRQRIEAARQQAMQRRAIEGDQSSAAAPSVSPFSNNRGSAGPAPTVSQPASSQASAEAGTPQFANPDVIYMPVGDPRRKQGLGSLIGR